MSMLLAKIYSEQTKKLSREKILALQPDKEYNDGRTKQSFKDETDIQKIMARADRAGTISHLEKFEGTYADFSDFDFHEQTTKLSKGREIFDALPAEVRREFGQSPAAFFAYVNDVANKDDLAEKLPDLAKPGQQLKATAAPDADTEAVIAASIIPEPISATATSTGSETVRAPEGG